MVDTHNGNYIKPLVHQSTPLAGETQESSPPALPGVLQSWDIGTVVLCLLPQARLWCSQHPGISRDLGPFLVFNKDRGTL